MQLFREGAFRPGAASLGVGFSGPAPALCAKSRTMPTSPTAPDLRNFMPLT
jgi:hypothetical protein